MITTIMAKPIKGGGGAKLTRAGAEKPIDIDIDGLDNFTRDYIACALWSSTYHEYEDDPLDKNYGASDIAQDSLKQMVEDCRNFQEANAGSEESGYPLEVWRINGHSAGHDFWLSRNGHGAGFWDRGKGAYGDELHKAAKVYGSCDLYVGDDKKIHIQ